MRRSGVRSSSTPPNKTIYLVLPPPEPMPVLPGPAVPVLACSRRHFSRSSPISVSQRPLLGAGLVVPLEAPPMPTLVYERGLVPWAPALSPLVPVDGGRGWGSGRGAVLRLPLPPVLEPMLDPD